MMAELFEYVKQLLVAHPMAAPLLFIAIHVALAALILPCSPMSLLAGALWGGVFGFLLSSAGALAAAAVTFLLSRSFLHDKITKYLLRRYPRVAGILSLSATDDWKLVAATQLNPLIPASVMGYVFGLTRISLARYLVLSAIFMIPLQLLMVYAGQTAASTSSLIGAVWLVFLLTVAFLLLPTLSRLAWRTFDRYLRRGK